MALKAVLQNLDGVPESVRGEYVERDGKFYLDIESLDDHDGVGALKRAKDYEKENARKAKERGDQLQSDLDKANEALDELKKKGVPKGDVERLEESYKDKLKKKETELTATIDSLKSQLNRHLVEEQSMKLATDMALKPEFIEGILPHIRSRLSLESNEGGEQVVRILDKEGKASALNMDDLKKEVGAMKALQPLMKGTNAKGGGAGGGNSENGGGASKKFGELNEAERVQYAKDDPAGYKRDLAEAQAASKAKW